MKILKDKLKPYWKELIFIIILHIITAVGSIMLPSFTSKMVDTGIQNQGFEYGLPIKIKTEGLEKLESLMNPEDRKDLIDSYEAYGDILIIKDEVLRDKKEAKDLEEKTIYAMAAYKDLERLDPKVQDEIMTKVRASNRPTEEILNLMPELKDYPKEFLRNLAVASSINAYENTGSEPYEIQKAFLLKNGVAMLLIAVIAFISAATAHYVSAHVGTAMGRDLRRDVFNKVINFSNNELSQFSTASLITRTTNDVQQITLVFTMFLRAALITPIVAIVGLVMILRIRPDMAWVMGVGIGGLFLAIALLFVIVVPAMKKIPENLDNLNLVTRENLTGVQVIRAFGRQFYEERRFDKANARTRDNYLFIDRWMNLITPVMIFIADIMGALIIWIGAKKIAGGTMQVGQMISFTAYSMRIFFSFLNVAMMSTMLPRSLVCLKRIKEVLETENSIKDAKNPRVLEEPKGLVEFNDVSFYFQDADEPVLEDLNFTARPGETTAIIGATGSGKSSILNLIMRFVDANEGSVTIDGVDIKDLRQKDLREMIGYVPQKGVLFSGNIRSNIGYGTKDLDEETMVKSAQTAHAEDFINEKKNKYRARIAQGGSNVSGGQKQRLSIARAIAKDPKIYLFDDSFSALDYKTDSSLRKALKENVKDATVIIVAQRVSTILDANTIIVLDEGRIESMGTHQELLEKSEIYREIASSQLSEEELKGGMTNE